ncbi:MAG: ATP-binding protein, partial [Bacteroidota bacterium]
FEDNGKGFDFDTLPYSQGHGLHNIRSRVENLKGSFYVDSMPKRGTIVTIVIPFQKPSAGTMSSAMHSENQV